MNKNFEEAYQAEVQLNIPDLWNRIESSLPEKTIVKESAVAEKKTTFAPVNNELKAKNVKKKNPYAWLKWASLAAAGLLIVIMVPAVVGVGLLSFASKDMASADGAATESCDSVVMEDVAQDAEMMPETDMMYDVQERPENGMDIITNESGAESETDYDGGAYAEEDESVKQETAAEEAVGAPMLATDLSVKVIAAVSENEEGYYSIIVEIPEDSYGVFERREEFKDGELEVWVYFGDGVMPEIGEWYSADIYEMNYEALEGTGTHLAAELEPNT